MATWGHGGRLSGEVMIIESLLDTDLYKFSMMQVVLHQYPAAQVEYRFKCREPGVDLASCIDEIRGELAALCQLRFTPDELDYLRSLRYIKSDFVDFLGLFQLNEKYVDIAPSATVPGEIDLRIRGPWLHTILFEVPLLAIISEVYCRRNHPGVALDEGRQRLHTKIAMLRDTPGYAECKLADYGTRRRYSRDWHREVVATLHEGLGPQLAGTSNVWLAWQLGLPPLGTLAH
jgi:nicotinate phosphoribosyltransferase